MMLIWTAIFIIDLGYRLGNWRFSWSIAQHVSQLLSKSLYIIRNKALACLCLFSFVVIWNGRNAVCIKTMSDHVNYLKQKHQCFRLLNTHILNTKVRWSCKKGYAVKCVLFGYWEENNSVIIIRYVLSI